jgi:signal transduction histidine kinase
MSEREQVVALLRQCSLFHELTDDELALLGPFCRIEEDGIGQVIFSEGQPATHLYVITKGKVTLEIKVQFGSGRADRRATAEVVEPYEVCGWSALVEPYTYTMTAICLEPTTVVSVPAADLRELLTHCPMGLAVMKRLAELVASRLKHTRDTLLHSMAVLSHDMKAPRAAIESYNQVLLGEFAGPINQEQREMLERNSVRIKELLTLISDLLDISRIESGNLSREFEPVSLSKIGEECLAVAQALGEAHGVRVEGQIPADPLRIVAAGSRLRQVFTNLLSNAVKFTPEGGTVTLRLKDKDDAIEAQVIDTGTGISPDDLPRIFDDFYTGKNVEAKGQGLGLAIARKIVLAHKGRIWVESPYPAGGTGGSCFTFAIPKNLQSAKSH